MPIPRGAHQIRGAPNRVRLASGEVVTRARALSMGAQGMGYRSHHAYRSHASGDEKYFRAFMNTPEGQAALASAQNRNPNFTASDLKQQLIAARNARPHGGNSGGTAYYDFMEEYDYADYEDFDPY